MKKFLAFLCSGMMVFGSSFRNIFATEDYQVHVAVFCKEKEKGLQMIKSMCKQKGNFNPRERKVFFTGEKNDSDHSTVVYDEYDDANYHIDFHLLSKVDTAYYSKCRNLLEKCSEAIILYDISDSTLNPITEEQNLTLSGNMKSLLDLKTPLTNFIDKLQYNKYFFIFPGWYDSLDFVSYGKENLSNEDYTQRQTSINRFTCMAEKYYGIDNKWGRGHPDISLEKFYEYTLFGIVGSAYRSIVQGAVKGIYSPKNCTEKIDSTLINEPNETTSFFNSDTKTSIDDDDKDIFGCDDAQMFKKKSKSMSKSCRYILRGVPTVAGVIGAIGIIIGGYELVQYWRK